MISSKTNLQTLQSIQTYTRIASKMPMHSYQALTIVPVREDQMNGLLDITSA